MSSVKQKSSNTWDEISLEFEINKRAFGKKINFVTDLNKRKIIFRDVEHAYELAKNGFYKPAVILSGSIIEELLRLYLIYKEEEPNSNNFYDYIKTCENKGFFKKGIRPLSDSVRHFRNLVHIKEEESKKHAISKAAAKSAVSSIFIIVNDLNGIRKPLNKC